MNVKKIAGLATGLCLFGSVAIANAATYELNFDVLEVNGAPDIGSSYSMFLTDEEAWTIKIANNDGTYDSEIADIYFDDNTSVFTNITFDDGTGVDFTSPTSPPDLSGGQNLEPPFDATYSAGSASPSELKDPEINDGEYITFSGTLDGGLDALMAAIWSGDFRVGLKIQSINCPPEDSRCDYDGASQTYVNQVPLPGAVWLFGSAILGFAAFSNRRKV